MKKYFLFFILNIIFILGNIANPKDKNKVSKIYASINSV